MITVYEVIDPKGVVVKVKRTRRAAMAVADKLDQEYGASIHRVRSALTKESPLMVSTRYYQGDVL